MGSKRRTRSPSTDPPPPSRRRRLNSGPLEWRDWPALPGDVLWVILSLVPQADALLGAGLACASWWRVAAGEPLLWRHIDLADEKTYSPAACQAMARAAVQRSAGRCESFRGRVDGDVLPFLVHSAPSLRSLHVTRARGCTT
ncbi:putative F-box/LRR-repeat protein 22 [Triticum aestivum]|uniref:putative F-box/LRR-repeat protein 22 n=1 Tax=Triticum aestivum TaxID=4565 RepID=UPI001D008E77|nr:putative F-box/LRR-repeat protein 22 [Triticum aestivum]